MKTSQLAIISVLSLAGIFACENEATLTAVNHEITPDLANETPYNPWDRSRENPPRYDGSDSSPISKETATAWIKNYNEQTSAEEGVTHYFNRAAINEILKETNCTGIRLYYALTDAGERLIICGVNNRGENLTTSSVLVASATGSIAASDYITLSDARSWTERFQQSGPAAQIRSHYFGRNIISKIMNEPGCNALKIRYAFDNSGEKKLILSGTSESATNGRGHTTGREHDGGTLADFSFPCPSVCPPGGGL